MAEYIIIALLSGLLLYFLYKYVRLKYDIKELKYNLKNKIEYNSINAINRNIDYDLADLMNIYDELILENNNLSVNNSKIEENYKDLMANLSHDLRTPLTSVMGYIALAKEEEDMDKTIHYLNTAEKKAVYLNSLIEKFYELSILSSDRQNIEKNYADLMNIIYSAGFEYYDIFMDRNQSFEIVSDIDKLEILTSEKLMDNVIHNVLDNMVKYSLGANRIEVYKVNENIKIVFSNKTDIDNGDYDFLFERSRVLDSSRSSSTGLGLSIADLILKKLGYSGKIYVENGIFRFEIIIKK